MAFRLPRIEAAIQMVDQVTAPMRQINVAIQSAMAPVTALRNNLEGLGREARLAQLGAAAVNFKDKVSGVGDGFTASMENLGKVLAVGGAVVGGLFALTKGSADAGDQLNDTAVRIGVSTDMLQRWRYAAQLSGSSVETLDSGMERFGKNLSAAAAGSGEAAGALQAMGVKIKDNRGRLRDQEAILLDVADAMAKIPDAQDRLRVSSALFGKGAQDLVTTMTQGSAGVKGLFSEYQKMGGAFKQKDIDAGAAFNDNFDRATFAVKGMAFAFSAQLFPVFSELSTRVATWVGQNQGLIQSIGAVIATQLPVFLEKLVSGALATVQALAPIGQAILWLADLVGPFTLVLGGLAAFIAGPLVLALGGALVALVAMVPAFLTSMALITGWITATAIPAVIAFGGTLLGLVGTIFTAVIPAIYSMGVALMTTPVGWILAAVAAIAGAAYLIYRNWDTVSGWFTSMWSGVSAFLDTSVGKIIAVFFMPFIGIPLLIIKHWSVVSGFLSSVWASIVSVASSAWASLSSTILGALQVLGDGIRAVWSGVVGFFSTTFEVLGAFFDTGVGRFVAALVPFIAYPILIYKHWEGIKTFFTGIWDGIGKGFSSFVDFMSNLWDKLNGSVGKAADTLAATVKGVPILGGLLSAGVSFFGTNAPAGDAVAQGAGAAVQAAAEPRSMVYRTDSRVAVDFNNLPAGSRVSQPVGSAPVDISAGFAFPGGM